MLPTVFRRKKITLKQETLSVHLCTVTYITECLPVEELHAIITRQIHLQKIAHFYLINITILYLIN